MPPASPAPPDAIPHLSRSEFLRIAIAWGIPILPLITFTLEWLTAWATLGHIPQPSLNDPKSISDLCSFLHLLTFLSFLFHIPLGIAAGLLYLLSLGPKLRRLLVALIGWGMTFGVFAVLDKFPCDALGWWFD